MLQRWTSFDALTEHSRGVGARSVGQPSPVAKLTYHSREPGSKI